MKKLIDDIKIREGKCFKGGVNNGPVTPPPKGFPSGQGGNMTCDEHKHLQTLIVCGVVTMK